MNNRVYESAVLINAALDDEAIKNLVTKIRDNIAANGGEIIEVEDWGRKRLAYQVKKSKIGYYTIFRFNAPSDIVPKLERNYQLDENILRYLTVALSKDALEQIEIDKSQQTHLAEEVEIIPVVPPEADEDDAENNVKDE